MKTSPFWILIGLLFSFSVSAADMVRLSIPTDSASMAPRITALAPGRAVLTWMERSKTGHEFRFAMFDGEQFGASGIIHQGERFFVNWADTPGLTITSEGDWLAHWLARSGEGRYAYDVVASISHDQGETWSMPFSPHDDRTPTEHGFVSYFSTGSRQTGMVWLDGRMTRPDPVDSADAVHHGSGEGAMTLRSALIDAAGRVSGGTQIDARVCDCCGTAAGNTDEGVVVIYRDRSEDEIRDIKLVRQTGTSWSTPVPVHDDGWQITGCPVNGPALLARAQTVIVGWFTMAGGKARVQIARSDDGGRSFSVPLELDPGLALGRVDLAWTRDGYALSWLSKSDSGVGGDGLMRLARFSASGSLISTQDLLPMAAERSSGFPKILDLGDDRLLVAWTGQRADVDHAQVQAAVLDNW